jgi:hypothetical protein
MDVRAMVSMVACYRPCPTRREKEELRDALPESVWPDDFWRMYGVPRRYLQEDIAPLVSFLLGGKKNHAETIPF